MVASTTMVADLARVIGGDAVEVIGLMGAGVDPHMYQVPSRALVDIKKAGLIFYNGLRLEGKSDEIYESQRGRGAAVVAVAEVLEEGELIEPEDAAGYADPHVWGDVSLWSKCAEGVVEALVELDPDGADGYRSRAEAYREELAELHSWAKGRVAEIPEGQRVLVTSHDAFGYFGRAYGLEVVGLQGISTDGEISLAAVAELTDLIKERGLKAIFVESSVNQQAIRRIAEDAGVEIGGELFSDALGAVGEMETADGMEYDLGTYTGMIRHNVNTVVDALR